MSKYGPWIDMRQVIASPMLAGTRTFDVERRLETITDVGGRTVTTTTWLRGVRGVIYPAGSNNVSREVALVLQGKGIVVVTMTRLYGVAKDGIEQRYQPDIVHFRDSRYQVVALEDYSEWADGFVQVPCASIDYVDVGPEA